MNNVIIVNLKDAPEFIAQLIREGVGFNGKPIATHETSAPADAIEITFTGGF